MTVGIPYVQVYDFKGRAHVFCPECDVRIELTSRKDFESYSLREYQEHYEKEHAAPGTGEAG